MSISSNYKKPSSHTQRFEALRFDDLEADSIIIIENNADELRGQLPLWAEIFESNPERIISIDLIDKESIYIVKHNSNPFKIALNDTQSLTDLITHAHLYIDISSLPHHVWAPILKAAFEANVFPKVIYTEPASYKTHPTPTSFSQFDLTESCEGLAPLPGFVKLFGRDDETNSLFIAMLGFEGNRPQHLAMQLEPPPHIIPVIGVPGFKLEYPEITVACNNSLLRENNAYADIRYARASCPFEVYDTLSKIKEDYNGHYMYIAPLGTKPHALGAVWFVIQNPDNTELMYDHPIRKQGRTRGVGTIHIYDLGGGECIQS